MKLTIESTSKVVELNGVPARIWEGETESGIKVHCFITRVAHEKDETRTEQFQRELQETRTPSTDIQAYPLRLVL
jgi:hypothetical protein